MNEKNRSKYLYFIATNTKFRGDINGSKMGINSEDTSEKERTKMFISVFSTISNL